MYTLGVEGFSMERRSFIGLVGGAMVTSAGCTQTNQGGDDIPNRGNENDVSASVWPMFQVDARNSGRQPNTTGPTNGVTERWRFQPERTRYSEIAVNDQSLFAGHETKLFAIDKSEGSRRWSFTIGATIRASPAVADGTVYVRDPVKIFAVNAETGEQLWNFRMKGSGDGYNRSGLTFFEGTIYAGGVDGHVYAVDGDTGEQLWRSSVGGNPSNAHTPAIYNDTVFVTSQRNNVFALDTRDGTKIWHDTLEMSNRKLWISAPPTVSRGTVFVGVRATRDGIAGADGGRVYGIATEDGTVRWQTDTTLPVWRSPATDSDTVYVGTNSGTNGRLYALLQRNGKQRWKMKIDGGVSTAPVLVGSTLYVGLQNVDQRPPPHALRAYSTKTRVERWRHRLDEIISPSTLAVVEDDVYFGAASVYALTEQNVITT